MATEAEIIPEPISLVKTEEESIHLTSELCDKAVEIIAGDLKKFQGGFNQPAETDECLAKAENMQVGSDNGVKTIDSVSEGNPEISKGEGFLISPETAKLADKDISGMTEHSKVDETSGTEKDQTNSDSIGDTLISKVEESSEIKDHETSSDISADAKKELTSTSEEVACEQEPAPEVNDKIEEVSGIIIKDQSQATTESSEEIKYINGDNDDVQDKNVLDTSTDAVNENIIYQSTPEGNISEVENTNAVQQSHEGESVKEEILNVPAQNEPEKDVNTAISIDNAETSTSIKEVTSIKDNEGEEGVEDTAANTETVSKNGELKEEDHRLDNGASEACKNTECIVTEMETKVDEKGETIAKAHELDTEEKSEGKDAIENTGDSLEQEETVEVSEGPKPIILEACPIIDDSEKYAEEEIKKSLQEDEKEETCEVEVCEKPQPNNTDENTEKHVLEEEDATKDLPKIEEKTEEESAAAIISIKEEIKDDSKAENKFEVSTPATDEENSVEKGIEEKEPEKEASCEESETALSGTGKEIPDIEEQPIADISNSSVKLAEEASDSNIEETYSTEETAEQKNDTWKDKESQTADVEVKPAESSISCAEDKEIPQEEDGVQDKIPNTGSEDQVEMSTREIPLKEILGDEVKECSNISSQEPEKTPIEEKLITDEIPETPASEAADETLMQKEDNIISDVPEAEPESTRKQSEYEVKEHLTEEPYVGAEQETGKDSSASEVADVPKEEEPRELEDQSGACDTKIEDEQPLDEAMDLGETSAKCKDGEKSIQEEEISTENLEKSESLKEDTIDKEEIELARGADDQIPDAINMNDIAKNAERGVEGFEEKPESISKPVAEVEETFPESSDRQADETSTEVHNQESEKPRKEELEDKLEGENYNNKEQDVSETIKNVKLSDEVNKEVEKDDVGEGTTNEVEDQCFKDADSKEQLEAKNSDMEEHSTKDNDESLVRKESEERGQDEEPKDPVSVHGENRELEEKIEEVNEELVNMSNSSDKMSPETTASDANQDTQEVEDVQLKEISSDLAPQVPTNDIDEGDKQSLNVETVDKHEAEVTERDPDAAYMPKDQTDEAEQSLPAEKVDELPTSDHELVETKSETSKAPIEDKVGKIELAPDGDCLSGDKDSEEDAQIKTSLTAEELDANKVEETTSSNYISQETTVEAVISSPNTLLEDKPTDQLQTSTSSLPSEDKEIITAELIEKREEEIQKDDKNQQESSDTKTTEEACSQKEEESEAKVVSEEENVVDRGLQKDELKEQIQTTSSALPSEEGEHGTEAISEKIEYDATEAEVPTELDDAAGEAITGEQTLSADKPEEGTTSSGLPLNKEEEEMIRTVEKVEEEKIEEAEIPEKDILEDSSDAKRTTEICSEKEEIEKLEDNKKDETAAAQTLTSSSTLPLEDLEHETTASINEREEEKVKEEEMLEKERPEEPNAVLGQETTVAQASITEESLATETISTNKVLDEEKINEPEKPENENCEDGSAVETEKTNELQAVPKEEITTVLTSSEEQSDEQLPISTSATASAEMEHETKKIENEETNKEEIIKDETPDDASDARTIEEVCSQKERSIELEAVTIEERSADHTVIDGKLEEQVQNPSAQPSKEEECGSTSSTEKLGSEEREEAAVQQDANGEDERLQKELLQEDEAAKEDSASAQTLPTEKPEEQILSPSVSLPSEEHEQETVNQHDKTEEEKVEEEEKKTEDSNEATVQESADHTVTDEKLEEQVENPFSAQPSKEEECGSTSTTVEIGSEKTEEAEVKQDANGEDECLQKELVQEDEAAKDDGVSAQTLPTEKPEEQILNPSVSLPSEEPEQETVNQLDKTEEEKVEEEEKKTEDSNEATVQESADHTATDEKLEEQVENPFSAQPSKEEECGSTSTTMEIGSEKTEEAEVKQDANGEDECLQKELLQEDEAAKDDGVSAQTLPTEKLEDKISNPSVSLPSEEHEQETVNEVDKTEEEKEKEEEKKTEDSNEATVQESVDHTVADELEEQIQNPFPAQPLKEEECGSTSTTEKIGSEKTEAEVQQDASGEDECLQKELVQEDEATKDDSASAQTLPTEKPEEQILNPSVSLPSEEHEQETVTEVDKTEDVDVKEEEKETEDSNETTVQESADHTVTDKKLEEQVENPFSAQPSKEEECVSTTEKMDNENVEEAEVQQDANGEDECLQKELLQEDEAAKDDSAAQTLPTEKLEEQISNPSVSLASEEHKQETVNVNEADKTEEDEVKKEEKKPEESNEATIQESADHTVSDEKLEEQVQNPFPAQPLKEEECGSEITEEVEVQQEANGKDECLQKDLLQEEETAKADGASAQTLPEKLEEQIANPSVSLPSEEHTQETANEVDKPEEEKVKEEENKTEVSNEATVQEICSGKDETMGPGLEGETISQVIAEETQEHGTSVEGNKTKEAETQEDNNGSQSEFKVELQGASEDGATAGQNLSEEKQADQLHITTSSLPSREQEDEAKETELQEDESQKKIPEQTKEIEEDSDVKAKTHEKADNELLAETEDAVVKEEPAKAADETRDEENQSEKTNEGNEIILNEVPKEEVMEDKEVIETSYSTSLPKELTNDGYGGDPLKHEQVDDKTAEAFETTTCQKEELAVEAQMSRDKDINEKEIVCEDKTVDNPDQASVAIREATTVPEEESSIKLSEAEGTKDLGEGNEVTDDIQRTEETTTIESHKQIPRELDHIETTEITSSISKDNVSIDLQDNIAESSQKAEVGDVKEIYPKAEEVEQSVVETTDNLGDELSKESTLVEDSVSLSDHIESSTKETLQATVQDMIEDREAKDETVAAPILVEKPVEESPAQSSKVPSEEGEHGVTTKVEAVEEKELKKVETRDIDSSDTKTGGEICSDKEENKELKAVMEQENIAVQASPAELKEDRGPADAPAFHLENIPQQDELKDEDYGDKRKETLEAPANQIQNEELLEETQEDGANNTIEKENIAEDKTVKDLEHPSVVMDEATTVRKEIPEAADEAETTKATEQKDKALETLDKAEVGDLEPGNAREIDSEAGMDNGKEKKAERSGVETTLEPESDSAKLSLSDLLQRATREKTQVAKEVIEERELTVSKEEPHVEEAEEIQVKEAKTDEEKEEGEEGDEQHKADSGSDAPVMVEAPRDADTKPHKKSHNILSGVGSKVKHSISKVKKAITGKSSHSKEPKPISPKGSEK